MPGFVRFPFNVHSISMAQALLLIIFASNADSGRSAFSSSGRLIIAHSSDIGSLDVDDIHVCLEKRLDRSLSRIQTDWNRPEDTGHDDSVTRFDQVDQFVVCAQRNGMRCLSVRNGI